MAQTKLILTEDVPSLGNAGDLVGVKPGYARNYLLPQGKAIAATKAKVKELEHHQRVVAEKVARHLKTVHAERDRLQQVSLEVSVQVGEEGKLFGSVTAQNVADLLKEKGFEIDRKKIAMDGPIKEVGEHEIPIRLHRELDAKIVLKVTAAEG